MKVKIKGFIEFSMLDWDGKIVSTLYTPYCNLRCPYCHNSTLVVNPEKYETIPFDQIKRYLVANKDWIDGVCISGGEPCIYDDIVEFIQQIKCDTGMLVKLDTNGTFPDKLKYMLDRGLVDYIAMDIKAPLNTKDYCSAIGVDNNDIVVKVKESIDIIMSSDVEYEFRTTIVPKLHTQASIISIAQYIKGAKKYALQNFVPRDTLDISYLNITPYSNQQIHEIYLAVVPYVKDCVVRTG
jgi:pyruvate formate lyase activating enzyme